MIGANRARLATASIMCGKKGELHTEVKLARTESMNRGAVLKKHTIAR
jgi:hypothetical protein